MPLLNIAGRYADSLGRGFQGIRDYALDRFAPRPEALFVKAMTGGAPTQTTMTDTELGKIKDAFQKQKRFDLIDPQEAFEKASKKYAEFANSGSPFAKFAIPPTLEGAQKAYALAKAEQEDPVTSLYDYGRDVKMSYGNLSVYPQPDGGVRIYDRWKVDKNLGGRKDKTDRVRDLAEGGPVASMVYNFANKLGTYKPFDIDVTIPGEQWKQIQPIGPDKSNVPAPGIKTPEENKQIMQAIELENQGGFLNYLNNLYRKFNPEPKMNVGDMAGPPDPGAFAAFMKNLPQ